MDLGLYFAKQNATTGSKKRAWSPAFNRWEHGHKSSMRYAIMKAEVLLVGASWDLERISSMVRWRWKMWIIPFLHFFPFCKMELFYLPSFT
jgi:hypothetical protein